MPELSIKDLKGSLDFLNILYDNLTSAIFLADSGAHIRNFNDSFKTLFQKPEDQLLHKLCGNAIGCSYHIEEGKDCGETSHCPDCALRKAILSSIEKKTLVYRERVDRIFFIGGRRIEKHLAFSSRFLHYSGSDLAIVIFDDLTELEESRLRLESMLRSKTRELIVTFEELRRQNHEKAELTRELQHRVGNTIQVILSLLSLQLMRGKEEAASSALAEAKQRIEAIGILYGALILRTDPLVELPAFALALIERIAGETGERREYSFEVTSGPSRPIEASSLWTSGILMNEFLNKAKEFHLSGVFSAYLTGTELKITFRPKSSSAGNGDKPGISSLLDLLIKELGDSASFEEREGALILGIELD